MESNDNITRLLEMLDHAEAYSEQDIRDIIDSDDETREAYRLMVAARQGYASKDASQEVDAAAAWQRLSEKLKAHPQSLPKGGVTKPSALLRLPSLGKGQGVGFSFSKIAASFIGLILMSGIAFAAINIAQRYGSGQTRLSADSVTVSVSPMQNAKQPEVPVDTLALPQPVVFDNIPLETMLHEIGEHYAVEVRFQSDETRSLRFHFVWNPQQEIEKVVADLNHFERVHVALKDNKIIVE